MKYRDYTVHLAVPLRIYEDDVFWHDGGPSHKAALGLAREGLYDVGDDIASGYVTDLTLEDEGEEEDID